MYCQIFGRYYYTTTYPGAFFTEATHFLVDPYYQVLPYLIIIIIFFFQQASVNLITYFLLRPMGVCLYIADQLLHILKVLFIACLRVTATSFVINFQPTLTTKKP